MKILIFWLNIGPYHIARLAHLAKYYQVTAVELLRAQTDHYYWQVHQTNDYPFEWITLFPSATREAEIIRHDFRQKFDELCARINPDVLLIPGYSPYWPYYMLQWAKQYHKPPILMIDSNAFDKRRNFFLEWIKSRIVRRYDGVIAAGTTSADYMHYLGQPRDRIFTGYDVVDNDYFMHASQHVRQASSDWREKLALPDKYFLVVARLVPKKNLMCLLRAYHRYRQHHPSGWGLVICGEGPLRAEIEWLIRQLDIPDVVLAGFVQIDTLPVYYALASALVLASTEEQWGLVINEAMACGLPIICSRSAGASYDLVRDGENGYIIEPTSVESLCTALSKMTSLSVVDRAVMGELSLKFIADWSLDRFADSVRQALGAVDFRPEVRWKGDYLLLQTVLPDYRMHFVRALKDKFGDHLQLYAGNHYFTPSVKTAFAMNQVGFKKLINYYLFSQRLLIQFGMWQDAIRARVVVAEGNPRILSTWVLLLIRKLLRRRTVLWMHAWARDRSGDRIRHLLRSLADALVVYTHTQAIELFERMGRRKVIVAAPNSLYPQAEMRTNMNAAEINNFIYVGRLVVEKKVMQLLKAFHHSLDRLPDKCNLIIIGEGPERENLSSYIEAYGLHARVLMPGHLSDFEQLRCYYDTCLASVSPGYVGLSITQSFAFGVPMIISRHEPHSPEIEAAIPDENCVFYSDVGQDTLAHAMLQMIRDRNTWIAHRPQIVEFCVQSYSVEVMSERMVIAFRGVS